MAIELQTRMSVEAYLERESVSETKHEYVDGMAIEAPGATWLHNRIAMNAALALGAQLAGSPCALLGSDMRLQVTDDRYFYPDLSAVCEAPQLLYGDMHLLNPTFVMEITSPSSVLYDHVDKLGYYRELDSLEAYLIISHDRVRADLYTRSGDHWTLRTFTDHADVVPLAALDCALSLERVYSGTAMA